jgi:DNA-binding protein YbaB
VLGISLTTIFLMLFLRSNPDFFDTIIEEQKSKLAGLYTENLKPLFITAGLTNEDIFDFALYRKLPLDRERGQYLMLGSNEDGSNYFEIKTASMVENNNDFEKFISALNLNEKQKIQIDSILDFYAQDMQEQILVNENNTVAISPKLWNYNKAIFADVMAFAKECNGEQFTKIVPAGFRDIDKPQLVEIAEVVKAASDSDYIFMTPDTIFIETFRFDKGKFDDEMKKMHVELKKNLKEAEDKLRQQNFILNIDKNIVKLRTKGKESKFEIFIDTNTSRVQIPDMHFDWSEIQIPNLDALEDQIEAATKNLQSFTIKIPKEGHSRQKFEFRVDTGDSSQKFNFDIDIPNFKAPILPDAFMNDSTMSGIYNFKADSISNVIRLLINDSVIFNQKDFHIQMKEFQKEMRKLREEMLKLQKNLQKEPIKAKSDEPIEI